MNTPDILLYAKFDYNTAEGAKTPKYKCVSMCGYYYPFETLKSKSGINLYLMESRKSTTSTPEMYLQAKNSLNLTGLYNYFQDGKLSDYCCGNPLNKPTFGNKKKLENPFHEYKDDCFLFIMHYEDEMYKVDSSIKPSSFEMLVVKGGNVLKLAFLSQLSRGGFDDELKKLREQAKPFNL